MPKLDLSGIRKLPSGKWTVRLQHNGQRFTVGTYKTRKLAIEERDEARARIATASKPFMDPDEPIATPVGEHKLNPPQPSFIQRLKARLGR